MGVGSSSASFEGALHSLRHEDAESRFDGPPPPPGAAASAAAASSVWARVLPASGPPASLDDVLSSLTADGVRALRASRPRNLALLVLEASSVLSAAALAPASAAPAGYARVVHALRLLTRVLPVVHEEPAFAEELLVGARLPAAGGSGAWAERAGVARGEPLAALCYGMVAAAFLPDLTVAPEQYDVFLEKLAVATDAADAAAAEDAADAAAAAAGAPRPPREPRPVLPTLANAVWPMLLWAGGCTFPLLSPPSSPALSAARGDVLRALLALASGPLYFPPSPSGEPARSPPLDFLTSMECDFAPTLFYSLLNTACAYDPIGVGLPYAAALVGDTDAPVAALSLQLLAALLDYAPLTDEYEGDAAAAGGDAAAEGDAAAAEGGDGAAAAAGEAAGGASDDVAAAGAAPPPPPAPAPAPAAPPRGRRLAQFNIYRSMLAGLSDEGDFELILTAACRALGAVVSADGALLPGSYAPFRPVAELLVVLWKALDENAAFCAHVLASLDLGPALVTPLLYLLWSGRDDATRVGLLHIVTFTLLLLSGDRPFGVALNAALPTGGSLRAAFGPELPLLGASGAGVGGGPPGGSVMDLLVVVLHKVVVDGSPRLAGLYSCFLTIIANASPYAKAVSLPAAKRLVNLVDLFGSPRFLFARPSNYAFVAQLLETINNVLQYQYDSNGMLTYVLVRRRAVFERLAALTPGGWHDAMRERAPRRAAAADGAGAAAAPTAAAASASARASATAAAATATTAAAAAAAATSATATTAAAGGTAAPPAVALPGSPAGGPGGGGADVGGDDEGESDEGDDDADAGGGDGAGASGAAGGARGGAAAAAAAASEVVSRLSHMAGGDVLPAPAGAGGAPPAPAASAWLATDEWWAGVRPALPLDAVLLAVRHLTPLLERFVAAADGRADEAGCVELCRDTTLVGILPVPHAILVRRYAPSAHTATWFTTYIYSTIFLEVGREHAIWDAAKVKLFAVSVLPPDGGGAAARAR